MCVSDFLLWAFLLGKYIDILISMDIIILLSITPKLQKLCLKVLTLMWVLGWDVSHVVNIGSMFKNSSKVYDDPGRCVVFGKL
jgi:hypothetical protein